MHWFQSIAFCLQYIKTSFLFEGLFFAPETKAREMALQVCLPVADTAGYKLAIMLWCVCLRLVAKQPQ